MWAKCNKNTVAPKYFQLRIKGSKAMFGVNSNSMQTTWLS